MRHARKTLAIVAFAAMVGCTVKSPALTPTTIQATLQLHTTAATYSLARSLAQRYAVNYSAGVTEVQRRSFVTLMAQLEAGTIDYLISSHVPVHDDIWAAPLAVEGLVIVVNLANRNSDLTIGELRDVFSGRIRDWSAFGDGALEITPLTYRAGNDVSLEFHRMVMGTTSITGNALLMPGFEATLQQVAEDEGAVGYLPLSKVDDRVKVLAINGVNPTQDSMQNRRYPLRSTIYVIGREAPPPATFNFFGWVQSIAGQAVVAETLTALP